MGLSMFAYTYAVVGARSSRAGSIGPVLIDIAASRSQVGYRGINLAADGDWVFRSPMSWHPGGRKAMWVEGTRGKGATREGGERRVRIVELPDYRPARPGAARPMPANPQFAGAELSIIPALAQAARDVEVKVYGRATGFITYRRTETSIEKTYLDYSDTPEAVYSGSESLKLDPRGNSTYQVDVHLSGPRPGRMDLKLTFEPLGGERPARIVFDADACGRPASRGFAEYEGRRLEVGNLAP